MVNTASPLTQPMDIQGLAITLSAKNLNPTMLTVDNLRSLGVIPEDWELSKQPTLNQLQARLNFKNGVNIVAQQRNITFAEPISAEKAQAVKVPTVAKEFLAKFAKADYQTVSVAPKIIISFGDDNPTTPRQFLIEQLIASGPWREVGNTTPQASVNFVYQLEGCNLNLSVNEVRLRAQNNPNQTVAALLFSGSFNYRLQEGGSTTADLQGKIDRWSNNMETFREIVHQKFLGQSSKGGIFPSEVIPN
ncbi:MAG: hypothetical protein ACLFM2_02350 [Halothece sp.]